MKGLLIKDLLVLKKTGRLFLALIALYLFMGITMGTDFGPMMVFISGMLTITTFAYDEQAKWDAYALSMPISRRDIVRSKYLLAILLVFLGALLGALLSLAQGFSGKAIAATEVFSSAGLALCACLLFNSMGIPLLYKLGTEKTRMVLLVCYALPIMGIAFLMQQIEKNPVTMVQMDSLMHTAVIALPFVTIGLMWISYMISIKILMKKDL